MLKEGDMVRTPSGCYGEIITEHPLKYRVKLDNALELKQGADSVVLTMSDIKSLHSILGDILREVNNDS